MLSDWRKNYDLVHMPDEGINERIMIWSIPLNI